MTTPTKETPHLRLVIMGIPAIFIGTSGFATMKAWMPTATHAARGAASVEKLKAPTATSVAVAAPTPPVRAERRQRARHVRAKCAECGTVDSTRQIEKVSTETDTGIVGWATWRGRSETAEQSAKSYEVTIRMNDGSSRVLTDTSAANWQPGKRVVLIGGTSQSND
jgi:hypothetical protein